MKKKLIAITTVGLLGLAGTAAAAGETYFFWEDHVEGESGVPTGYIPFADFGMNLERLDTPLPSTEEEWAAFDDLFLPPRNPSAEMTVTQNNDDTVTAEVQVSSFFKTPEYLNAWLYSDNPVFNGHEMESDHVPATLEGSDLDDLLMVVTIPSDGLDPETCTMEYDFSADVKFRISSASESGNIRIDPEMVSTYKEELGIPHHEGSIPMPDVAKFEDSGTVEVLGCEPQPVEEPSKEPSESVDELTEPVKEPSQEPSEEPSQEPSEEPSETTVKTQDDRPVVGLPPSGN